MGAVGAARHDDRVRLVTLEGDGGALVDGALYEAGGEPAATPIVVHLHGKGGNFYSGPGRFVPLLTAGQPIAHLAVNGVCHDLGWMPYYPQRQDGPPRGGMWERIAEGRADVAAAVAFARELGHRQVFLCGHSSGGFYATEHAVVDEEIAGLILLSPVVTFQSFLRTWFPDPAALAATERRARDMVDTGVGHYLIPLAQPYFAISAASLVERLDLPADQWERQLARVTAPTLLLWGEAESRHALWAAIHERSAPSADKVTLPDAGHHYTGAEQAVADAVCAFVAR